jgi:hypothetical protein
VVANPIVSPAAGTYGSLFTFQFPADTFSDPDGNALTYSALGMPSGITFTSSTRTFSGTPTQAGVFPVAVAATDNGTPSLSVTNIFTITINKATPTATLAVNNTPVTYDGTGKAATVGITISSVPGAVANILTGGTATKTNAGTYAVTADFVPTDTANYNSLLAVAAGNFVINKATVTPVIVANNKVYDGGTNATLSSLTLTGVIAPDVVNLTNSTASFATATVGNGKTVTARGLGLTGAQAGNYQLSAVTATTLADITRAALGVRADDKTKTFGAADPAFTVSYSGFVNGETAAVLGGTLVITRDPGENVGSYPITPSGLTSANYAIAFNTGTLIITATVTTPAPLILGLTSAGPNDVLITWSAVSNATYRVQYKGVLSAANWTDLIGDVLSGGNTASKTDVKTATNRFYRVQVVP